MTTASANSGEQHLGYLWMAVGASMLGLSAVTAAIPQTAAVHASAAGTVGTMVLAVMTRVCRGHIGRALTADWLTALIYALVNLSAVARIAAAFTSTAASWLLMVAAALWITAVLLFARWCAPIVMRPRVDEAH
ncbi:NnrS family protein [Methylobacterium sp. P31]